MERQSDDGAELLAFVRSFSGDFTKINIAPGDQGGQLDSGPNKPNGAQMFVTDDNQAASNWVVRHFDAYNTALFHVRP